MPISSHGVSAPTRRKGHCGILCRHVDIAPATSPHLILLHSPFPYSMPAACHEPCSLHAHLKVPPGPLMQHLTSAPHLILRWTPSLTGVLPRATRPAHTPHRSPFRCGRTPPADPRRRPPACPSLLPLTHAAPAAAGARHARQARGASEEVSPSRSLRAPVRYVMVRRGVLKGRADGLSAAVSVTIVARPVPPPPPSPQDWLESMSFRHAHRSGARPMAPPPHPPQPPTYRQVS